jgi:hypothetical protein
MKPVKVPEDVVQLLELERRWQDAQFFVSQSDNEKEIEKAYKFIEECEKAFEACKVKFTF